MIKFHHIFRVSTIKIPADTEVIILTIREETSIKKAIKY